MRPCLSSCIGLLAALLLCTPGHAAGESEKIVHRTVADYLNENRAAGRKPNSLIRESSPYLLQHAYNPVQWYAWGEEAFERARRQDKPILLSIGYSTCYWCHVMAHESFENEKIASVLNEHFICIKVDREERPDIDEVYMAATEAVNGYGGWPMTVFLNHDLEPFHAGVYYPPFGTDQATGLYDLLLKVKALWDTDRARIDLVASQVAARIKAQAEVSGAATAPDKDVLARGLKQLTESYDDEHGGFGSAPKFPQPGIYALLLRLAAGDGAQAVSALHMLRHTLLAMARGGIYDQVGGGFHRYAVDAQWKVPHFEKMLYTQALMALAYTRLYRIEPDQRYREVATATLDFVLREMRHPQGAFYSALDASSERADRPGVSAEGAYYLWRAAELRSVLRADERDLVLRYFDVRDTGNIESDPRGEFENLNILHVYETFRDSHLTEQQRGSLAAAKARLYQARLKRPRPHLDDKIITAWNGMMIRALAEASGVFGNQAYLEAAVQAADFIQRHLVESPANTLLRRVRDGEAGIRAGLGDYAWTINGLLALHRQTKDKRWLELAQRLAVSQVKLFHDADTGGFYESQGDARLLFRSRSAYDGALPAPNAIAAENLYELAGLTGEHDWRQMADGVIAAFAASMNNDPVSAAWMLSVVGTEKAAEKTEP